MRASFNKRWLLLLGILTTLGLAILGVAVGLPFGHAADCSGASANDYACYQERYQNVVHNSGVEAAFAELKDEYKKNEFVRSSCHHLTHVIGDAALDLYGDMSTTYAHGDDFCSLGYYHAATEDVVAKIEVDKLPEEANTICADLREHQKYSIYHYACLHGLGHGFMAAQEGELFEALSTCDVLTDSWERDHCYGGVFMENIVSTAMVQDNPSHLSHHHPSKYLKADQPLYPCTDMQTRYKSECYLQQTMYALYIQGDDFAKVFDLCREVEEDFRWACYRGLGGNAAGRSIGQSISDTAGIKSTGRLCMLGENNEARSDCVIGAVKYFVFHYDSDEQAKALCGSFEADLRASCLKTAEGFYEKRYNKAFDFD